MNAEYARHSYDDSGNIEITFRVSPESKYAARQIIGDLKETGKAVLSLSRYYKRRSNDQNALMWALLEIMAQHLNGGRTGGVTAWDCYLDMLERYGAEYEYLQCTKEAFDTLKEMFRAIKVVEERGGGKTVMCKAYIGSSKYDTEQMNQLIEGIYDELVRIGADTQEARYYYEESKR